jgi:hypothetical protein
MALTRIVGNEGSVTFGAAGTGAVLHNITANSWSMTVSRVMSDVSAFDDTAGESIGGVPTYTGSVSGFMDSLTAGEPFTNADDFATVDRVYMTLTAASGCTYVTVADQGAIISGVSISSTKTGDATISFDFTFDGVPTENWSE